MDHDHRNGDPHASRSSRGWIAFAVMLAIAAFFLISEHRAHVLGALPYLLILACPLMHLFHHGGGHGGHGRHRHEQQRRESAESDADWKEDKS